MARGWSGPGVAGLLPRIIGLPSLRCLLPALLIPGAGRRGLLISPDLSGGIADRSTELAGVALGLTLALLTRVALLVLAGHFPGDTIGGRGINALTLQPLADRLGIGLAPVRPIARIRLALVGRPLATLGTFWCPRAKIARGLGRGVGLVAGPRCACGLASVRGWLVRSARIRALAFVGRGAGLFARLSALRLKPALRTSGLIVWLPLGRTLGLASVLPRILALVLLWRRTIILLLPLGGGRSGLGPLTLQPARLGSLLLLAR